MRHKQKFFSKTFFYYIFLSDVRYSVDNAYFCVEFLFTNNKL